MLENKFMFWCTEDKILLDDHHPIVDNSINESFFDFKKEKVIPLQYIGLPDVTGKDIYTGFILKNKDDEICEVKFGEYESSPDDYHSTTHIGFYLDFRTYISEINKANIDYKEYEIIGNIYENHGLIERGRGTLNSKSF